MTTYLMNRPEVPTRGPVTTTQLQQVWDVYVKPGQDAELPQSVEMRVLMAVLRSAYHALDNDGALPVPVVAPLGWEVEPVLMGELYETFLPDPEYGDPEHPEEAATLIAVLREVGKALSVKAPFKGAK